MANTKTAIDLDLFDRFQTRLLCYSQVEQNQLPANLAGDFQLQPRKVWSALAESRFYCAGGRALDSAFERVQLSALRYQYLKRRHRFALPAQCIQKENKCPES
jgi:hypothetical protein